MTNLRKDPGKLLNVNMFDEKTYCEELIAMGLTREDVAMVVAKTAEATQGVLTIEEHLKRLINAIMREKQVKRCIDISRRFMRTTEVKKYGFQVRVGDFQSLGAILDANQNAVPASLMHTHDKEILEFSRKFDFKPQDYSIETFEQAEQRFPSVKNCMFNIEQKNAIESSTLRKPPNSSKVDFFVPLLYDVATKDSRSIMDVAVFRLSKKDKRANETIRYERSNGYVEVVSGEAGMASIWDYDIVLMAISHLTDATNLYRKGRGEKPSCTFRPHVSEILKFCRRSDGGRQYEEIEAALKRLSTTFVEVVTTTKDKGKRVLRTAKGVGLINGYETVSYADNGRITSVSIEIPKWLYNEVVAVKTPEVLTVHPDYFLIEPGIGRFLYRLARRAAGKTHARWTFKLIYERSGSLGTFKEFCRILRRLISSNNLPEYTIAELPRKSSPLLVITHREASLNK